MLEWIELDSSVLAAVAYAAEKELLFAEFRGGEVYLYLDVAGEQFANLLGAHSRGHYFTLDIRDRFRFFRLGLCRRRN